MNFIIMQWMKWLKGVAPIWVFVFFGIAAIFLTPVEVMLLWALSPQLWRSQGNVAELIMRWRRSETRRKAEKFGWFIPITSFKPKNVDFRWMKSTELQRVLLRLVRLLSLQAGPMMVLAGKLQKIWDKSGTPFFILYLKECRLALIAWANRSSYSPNPGCKVRLSPCGLPAIVPVALRPESLSTMFGRMQFRCLHTVFSLYRVVDWKGAVPDFSSITNPFAGISETLPIQEIRLVLAIFTLPRPEEYLGSTSPWLSTSSGPNHPWSTWSSAKDTLGWALNPIQLFWFLAYAWGTRQYILAVWLVVLSHFLLPVALILLYQGIRFPLGRLSVLQKDGGGKRRIVGVVDFWTQWVLKKLHVYIFAILRRIPQDGTFDQIRPLQDLLAYARLGMPSYSFDLSNATDRLPVALQEQILSLLVGRLVAKAWRNLLVNRAYTHPKAGSIKYAVGQPIGALSSWAMLALTHHVVVQLAAIRAGWKGWYPLYALLGDDIVILREDVAREYLSIIRYLGVPINMGKSISSTNGIIEFAKRVVSSHYGDLSPMSPRLLVTAVRRPEGYLDLWSHILDLGFILFPNQLRKVTAALSADLLRKPFTAIKETNVGAAVIARVFILSRLQESGVLRPPVMVDEWFRAFLGRTDIITVFLETVKAKEIWEFSVSVTSEHRRSLVQLAVFITQWWRYPLFGSTLGGILSIPLLIFSPAYWVSLYASVKGVLELSRARSDLLNPDQGSSLMEKDTSVPNIPVLEIIRPARPNVKADLEWWCELLNTMSNDVVYEIQQSQLLSEDRTAPVTLLLAAPSSSL